MECVAYLRVSTEKQAEEGHGLDSQKRDIEDYCRKNDLIVSEWYVDDGYTGANMDRPALQRLILSCSKKRVKCVVAFKLDRLSRSMVDGLYLIERVFIPNGVDFRCVHDSVNYGTPMEQAYTQIMAAFAQLDKNTMMLRMRGGMLERVKRGYWYGGGNLPYCYEYDREKGILVPIPEKARRANMALELYIDGWSDNRISSELGFRSEQVVRSIITGVVNIGLIKYKGNIYQGRHEPVFDRDRFYLAQNLRKNRKKARSYIQPDVNVLTGLCYCGECGCKMRYQKWTKSQTRMIWCCSHDKALNYLPNFNPSCKNKAQRADEIERQVEEQMIRISLDLSTYMPKEKESRLDILISQLEKEKKKLRRLYDLYAEGNDMVLDMIRNEEEEVQRMEDNVRECEQSQNLTRETIAYKNVKRLADVWDQIDKPEKNKILKSIIDKVVIVNGDVEIQLQRF